jgi:hypothetical protein
MTFCHTQEKCHTKKYLCDCFLLAVKASNILSAARIGPQKKSILLFKENEQCIMKESGYGISQSITHPMACVEILSSSTILLSSLADKAILLTLSVYNVCL